jgi:hypothetical protein
LNRSGNSESVLNGIDQKFRHRQQQRQLRRIKGFTAHAQDAARQHIEFLTQQFVSVWSV